MNYQAKIKCPFCGKCTTIDRYEAQELCGDYYRMRTFLCECTMSLGRRMESADCLIFVKKEK